MKVLLYRVTFLFDRRNSPNVLIKIRNEGSQSFVVFDCCDQRTNVVDQLPESLFQKHFWQVPRTSVAVILNFDVVITQSHGREKKESWHHRCKRCFIIENSDSPSQGASLHVQSSGNVVMLNAYWQLEYMLSDVSAVCRWQVAHSKCCTRSVSHMDSTISKRRISIEFFASRNFLEQSIMATKL